MFLPSESVRFLRFKSPLEAGLLIVIITNNKPLVKHFEGPDAGFPQKIRNKYKKDLDARTGRGLAAFLKSR